jgi:hypothetical protein
MAHAGTARYSVDHYLEQKISWWWKVAEVRRPLQDAPAAAAAAIMPGPAAVPAVAPQPRTAEATEPAGRGSA